MKLLSILIPMVLISLYSPIQAQKSVIEELVPQTSECENDLPRYYNHTQPYCGISLLDSNCFTLTRSFQDPFRTISWPGCFSGSALHNPRWFTFVAGSDSIQFEFTIDYCQNGQGAQLAVYGPFDPTIEFDTSETSEGINPTIERLKSNCTLTRCHMNETLTARVRTSPGHLYGIVMDGCNGDICNISYRVIKGGEDPLIKGTLLPPSYDRRFFKNDSICEGATINFLNKNDLFNTMATNWTLRDETGNLILDTIIYKKAGLRSDISLTLNLSGDYELCLTELNPCDTTEASCIQIVVYPEDTIRRRDTICKGGKFNTGRYDWVSPSGQLITPDNGPIDVYKAGLSQYTASIQNPLGCYQEAELELFVIDKTYKECLFGRSRNHKPDSAFSALKVFPNPTQDYLKVHISARKSRQYTLELLDWRGQTHLSKSYFIKTQTHFTGLDLGHCSRGLYLLLLRNQEGEVIDRRKVVLVE
jgi:hypothetical protein